MEHEFHIFIYISNLVAKAPGLNLGKKLSNLLSTREASPNILYIFSTPQNNRLEKFMFPNVNNETNDSNKRNVI